MQNVPKIVRERLKATTPATEHPDVNALTAFAERVLPERERALVFDHLARCGDCRDIVALALPATEPIEVAAKPARGWLTWPALRWGLVAAGVMAIASLGIVQYQRGLRPENLASKAPAHVEVAAKEAKNEALAQPAFSADEKRDKVQTPPTSAFSATVDSTTATGGAKKGMARQEMTPQEPASALPVPSQANHGVVVGINGSSAVGGPLPHGPRVAEQWQQQNVAKKQLPAAPPSPLDKQQAAGDLSANMQDRSVSQMVTVEAESAQQEAKTQDLDAGQKQDQPVQQPSGEDYALAKVGRAKPAVTTPASAAPLPITGAPNGPQALAGPVLASSSPAPRWTITSSGGLQRSFDQDGTWQAIDVMANPESSTNATSLQISANNSRAKRKDAQALKKDAASPLFRAVAANGADVWAGGSGGALYHSRDAGDHWTRIVPAAPGGTLTGDIVSLEFADPQHGKVSTSTAEIWITADNGQTWQKQ
jgi:hypothetical protein